MDDSVFTVEKQIKTVHKGLRHIVILGAGASIASVIDNPEKNKKILPSMENLVEVLGLGSLLESIMKKIKSKNFESVFSYLFETDPNSDVLKKIEKVIYNYFYQISLSDSPTIYYYLVLSLRKKDLIASFNWDPFLWQAYIRNMSFTTNLPTIAFLHGNVAVGISEDDKTFGPKHIINLNTDKPFEPIKLLYPITKKNYTSDPYIAAQWNLLSQGLEIPARVTVFGYSAPKSDVEAIKIMKKAY